MSEVKVREAMVREIWLRSAAGEERASRAAPRRGRLPVHRRMALRRLLAVLPLAWPLLLAACAGFDLDKVSVPLTTPSAAAATSEFADMSPKQRHEHEQLVASYGGAYNDPALKALIQQVVERLVAASERPDLKYRVTVLNSPAINAFALPDGSLYVTRGLLALANDTSELSSVLAHEMAHVIARHAVIREDQVKQAVLVSRVIADVVNDPDLGALAMQKSRRTLASFSRGQELEADAIGVGIAARAGFDSFGASRFLTDMGRYGGLHSTFSTSSSSPDMDFLSSHPATPERISIAVANARQYANGGTQGDGERDKAAYLSALDGMVYGDDPKEGFVRGRKFFHPKLGFSFTAPEGVSLENTSPAVIGFTQTGQQVLQLDSVRLPPSETLAQHLSGGWIEGVDITTVENTTINGFTAATAIARTNQLTLRLFAIRFGAEVYRFMFVTRDLTPEVDRQFRASADTFRRVSPGEAEAMKPLRVRVVSVGFGDSAEKLAGRMQVPDQPLERFAILNGLETNAKLKYGEKVKIIAE